MALTYVSQPPEHDGNVTRPASEPARIPAVSIHAFCETPEVAEAVQAIAGDRRMARAHLDVWSGGIAAGIEHYRQQPSPHLIILESRNPGDLLIGELDRLAEVCEPGAKVVVIGTSNDISLYRELLERGVSEYLLAPVESMQLIVVIARLYRDSAKEQIGKAYAFIGAKGGVGASTIAHNVAWSMAGLFDTDVVLADLDLPFGTAALDFNLETSQGVAEAVQDSSRLDEVLLDRLLAKRHDKLSLLAAPTVLEKSYDLDEYAFDRMLDVVQENIPALVLDVPHLWTSWAKRMLVGADDVVITAAPDLGNLRNTKNLVDFLARMRPNDPPPKVVLNQVGMAKRPEIKPDEFAAGLELELIACIPSDPVLFGTAANRGQMIGEVAPKSKPALRFNELAQDISGRKPTGRRRAGSGFRWLWQR